MNGIIILEDNEMPTNITRIELKYMSFKIIRRLNVRILIALHFELQLVKDLML